MPRGWPSLWTLLAWNYHTARGLCCGLWRRHIKAQTGLEYPAVYTSTPQSPELALGIRALTPSSACFNRSYISQMAHIAEVRGYPSARAEGVLSYISVQMRGKTRCCSWRLTTECISSSTCGTSRTGLRPKCWRSMVMAPSAWESQPLGRHLPWPLDTLWSGALGLLPQL